MDRMARIRWMEQRMLPEVQSDPMPEGCPVCGADLCERYGHVGEVVLVCDDHGIVWEDQEAALSYAI